ncbi:MAG: hypothetical protein FWJ62_09790 [Thermaerobacter sp.]|nr:hypothetical protein [Bacillota bacterium]REJ37012.1 MAG: hypothetical protein DIU84_05100 [Bacillota bacterium]
MTGDVKTVVRRLIDKHSETATGGPEDVVQRVLEDPEFPQSPDALRQLEDAFGPFRRQEDGSIHLDYDDVVQQSFPASDPPPPPDRE